MKWIWLDKDGGTEYAEFKTEFSFSGKAALLKICADRNYAAFINGAFVSNGQYADLPEHKSVDEIDITPHVKFGENALLIIAYHATEDFAAARVMPAGVAFEVLSDGGVIAASGADTLCRKSAAYDKGAAVSSQIGYGYRYDFTATGEKWRVCRVINNGFIEEPRPVKKCVISKPVASEIYAQGVFKYNGGETAAAKAQNAWLKTLRFAEMTGVYRVGATELKKPLTFKAKEGGGVFAIADLGKETAGYLSLSVKVNAPCNAIIAWGEHLADLRVRAEREGRNFAAELKLAAGENVLDEYIHRLGCRYLCIFAETDEVTLNRLTLREALYPFKKIKKDFGDRLLNKIYDTGVRTLELCAHEHYEDCPWREQALYGMDSRNQMLFGYGAFGEYEFPRANLRLFARSLGADGLLDLCAPARAPITIPSFSLYFIIAVAENAEVDYDAAFVNEMLPVIENMFGVFEKRVGKNGLDAFKEVRYWNFHEWCDGLDGGAIFRSEELAPFGDGLLTALAIIAADKTAALEIKAGRPEKAERFTALSDKLAAALDNYYDANTGLYASYIKDGEKTGFHAYAQSLYIITGRIPRSRAELIGRELKEGMHTVPCTFAALSMKYDAIMKTDGDLNFIVNEICEVFGKMLFDGATSYWETAEGEADFNDAGSLCHGWSSVACYVFDKYGVK